MNVTGFVQRFLADLIGLPLAIKFILLYAVGSALWEFWRRKREAEAVSESERWPVYRARVIWAQVTDWQNQGEGDSYVEGVLTYSYTVPGHELEVGEYRKLFYDAAEAAAWARPLRDTFVDVRVDPENVTRSVYQEAPILASAYSPEQMLGSSQAEDGQDSKVRHAVATTIFGVAVFGAFLAAWIQLSCFRGRPLISEEENKAAFFGMHIGAMACVVGLAFIAGRGKWSRSSWKKAIDAGTSKPAIRIIGLYTTAVFLYGWVRMAARDGDPRNLGALMFSAIWLVFYASSAAGALHAIEHRARDAG